MHVLDYQAEAITTFKTDMHHPLYYLALGLTSEAGEVAGQVKRIIRDDGGELTEERRQKLADELGDVLWYTATLAYMLHFDLKYVMQRNLAKLRDRKARGVIKGEGDTR